MAVIISFYINGKKQTDIISFRVEFNNGRNGYSAQLKSGTDGFVFVDERLIYNSDSGVDISRSDTEAKIKTTDNYRAKYVIKYLNGFRKYHFHDTSSNSPFTQSSHIENDTYFLYEDGMNLAAFLYNIQSELKLYIIVSLKIYNLLLLIFLISISNLIQKI